MSICKTLIQVGIAAIYVSVHSLTYAQPINLTMQDSVNLALRHSPAVKTAQMDVAKTSWQIKENKASYLPAISANHIQTKNEQSTADLPANSHSTFLEAKTILYSGGMNEGLVAQAQELHDSARYNLKFTRQQVISNTQLAYYNVLQAEKNEILAEEAVQRLAQHLSIVEAQYAEGIVLKSDVLRTEVELAQAKQNESKAQNAHKMTNGTLITLLGLPPDEEITLADTIASKAYDGTLSQAIQTALQNRNDLKQTYQEQKSVQLGVQIAKSDKLPNVSLSVKKEWQNQTISSDNQWSAQLAVAFNVFDGSKTRAKIKQAELEAAKSGELVEQKIEQVTLEIREAFYNMQDARTAVDIASQVVAKAEEDYAIAQVRYQSGIGTNLDVIDSQGALTAAKLNYTNSLYDYSKYIVQLKQAMGTVTEDDKNDEK
jgi:outer membrane protein